MAKFIYGFLLIVTYSIIIFYRNNVNLPSFFENIKKNTNYIYNKIEIYIKQEINENKEILAKNKENKRVEDFEINFEGDIKFSFNEKTNKIERYIYIDKHWILLKR